MADDEGERPTSNDDTAADDVVTGEVVPDELLEDDELVAAPAEREPATVGAGAGRTGSSVARPSGTSPKGTPTARRDTAPVVERTTPAKFVRQSVGELRKVVYPTGQQLVNYFVVVLVFVLFIIAYVSLLDLGLGAAVFKVFS